MSCPAPLPPEAEQAYDRVDDHQVGASDRAPGPSVMVMPASDPGQALSQLGVRPRRVVALSDVPLGNANWLVETADPEPCVLRRYYPRATADELAYEQAVLGYL